jgi:hypothetical protein
MTHRKLDDDAADKRRRRDRRLNAVGDVSVETDLLTDRRGS